MTESAKRTIKVIVIIALLVLVVFMWKAKQNEEYKNTFCYISYYDNAYHDDDCAEYIDVFDYDKVSIKEAKDIGKHSCEYCSCKPYETTLLSGILEISISWMIIGAIVVACKL